MAAPKFRYISIYIDDVKCAEFNAHTSKFSSGSEPQFGDGVLLGWSEAIKMMNVDAKGVLPVGGGKVDALAILLKGNTVSLAMPIGGKLVKGPEMLCTDVQVDSDAKTGTSTLSATFSGGQPTVS